MTKQDGLTEKTSSFCRFDPDAPKILDSSGFPSTLQLHHGGAMTTYLNDPMIIAGSNGLGVEKLVFGSWVEYGAVPGKGHRAGLSAVNLNNSVYVFGGQERSVSFVSFLINIQDYVKNNFLIFYVDLKHDFVA